jgi:hypothetical protein
VFVKGSQVLILQRLTRHIVVFSEISHAFSGALAYKY